MKARLLQSTREHPNGQGSIVDVSPDLVAAYPRIYQSVEHEEQTAALARLETSARRTRESEEHRARKRALCAEQAGLKRAVALQLRAAANEAVKLAEEAELQAEEAECLSGGKMPEKREESGRGLAVIPRQPAPAPVVPSSADSPDAAKQTAAPAPATGEPASPPRSLSSAVQPPHKRPR